jgi:hypothetical protein
MFFHIAISDKLFKHQICFVHIAISDKLYLLHEARSWRKHPRTRIQNFLASESAPRVRNPIRTRITDPNPGGPKSDGLSGSGQLPTWYQISLIYNSAFKIHGVAAFWYSFKQCSGSGSGSGSLWAFRIRIRGTDPDPDSPIIKQK